MKIRVFQSDKGDCLLLTSASGKNRVLVDGGMSSSYTKHVAPALAKLSTPNRNSTSSTSRTSMTTIFPVCCN